MHVAARVWTHEDETLWERLMAHPFEDPAIDLDFARRLARALDWPIETARAAIEEYRRFCFLAVVATGAPVTPSEEVDEVWHLHLTYTRDYWEFWCGSALGRRLNHDPTAGGPVEQARYRAQYAETLALYEAYFGPPPAKFWPGTQQRFAARPRYRMVDRRRSLVLPRPSLRWLRIPSLAGLLTLVAAPRAAADTWNPLDLPGPDFLLTFVFLVAIAVGLMMVLSRLIRTTRRPADLHGLSAVAMGCANDGMARAFDALFLALAHQGVAETEGVGTIKVDKAREPAADLAAFVRELPERAPRKQMIEAFEASAAAKDMRADLRRRNVLMSEVRHRILTWVLALPPTLVIGLGVAKIFVGMWRNHPVEILFFLCLGAAIGLFFAWAWLVGDDATWEAKADLRALRTRLDRVVRAPRDEELALAVAFGGAAVLSGTTYAAYASVISPPSSSSSGGSSDSGCSSGGGGGCGGCSS